MATTLDDNLHDKFEVFLDSLSEEERKELDGWNDDPAAATESALLAAIRKQVKHIDPHWANAHNMLGTLAKAYRDIVG